MACQKVYSSSEVASDPNSITQNANSTQIRGRRLGFTIVELLIVVVVIAILAAITIVAYNGINNRAKASSAASAAQQATKKVMTFATTNAETYPATLSDAGVSDAGSTTYQYRVDNNANPRSFCITATSSNVSYYSSSTTTTPVAGACDGHAVDGGGLLTNLMVNPSFEANTTSWSSNLSTITRETAWADSGTYSVRHSPNSSNTDTFMSPGGDLGGFRLGMAAGKTYSLSATIRLTAPQTGALAGSARRVTLWYTVAGSHTQVATVAAPNAAGSTRLSFTFSIPSNATAAWIRLYNGASSGGGDVWWDSVMLTEGNTTPAYADGNTAGWIWNGTQNNATSTGPGV